MQEEELLQRMHMLTLAVETKDSLILELNEEQEKFIAQLAKAKEDKDAEKILFENVVRQFKEEIRKNNDEYETKVLSYTNRISELETLLETAKSEKPVLSDTVDSDQILNELTTLKEYCTELDNKYSQISIDKQIVEEEKIKLLREISHTNDMYSEIRESFEIKKNDLANVQSALKELQEENALLVSQNEMLKKSPIDDDARGNSLFKEVEDNRKKLASAYNTLKNKYLGTKSIINAKSCEIQRLKQEMSSMKVKLSVLDQDGSKSDCKFTNSLKVRVDELQHLVHKLENRKESPEIVTITENGSKIDWVHALVNEARDEARKTIADYQKISSASFAKAVELRRAELEIRDLKLEIIKCNGRNEGLELEISKLQRECDEHVKTLPDGLEPTKNGNRTVRFADDILEETTCNRPPV